MRTALFIEQGNFLSNTNNHHPMGLCMLSGKNMYWHRNFAFTSFLIYVGVVKSKNFKYKSKFKNVKLKKKKIAFGVKGCQMGSTHAYPTRSWLEKIQICQKGQVGSKEVKWGQIMLI